MKIPARDAELLQILDASFARSAAVAGEHLVCRAGCTQCCHGVFRINALDTARLAAGMHELRLTNPSLADSIEARAQSWLAEHGEDFPGDRVTGILGTSEEESDRFDEYASEAACPALNTVSGLCEVYAWRPLTCRVFGPPVRVDAADYGMTETDEPAFAHCELCFTTADQSIVQASELHVPHELESEILSEFGESAEQETIVAYALLRTPR